MVAWWAGPGFVLSSRFTFKTYLWDSKSEYTIFDPIFTIVCMEKLTFDSWESVCWLTFDRRNSNVLAAWAIAYLIYICEKISYGATQREWRPWLPTKKGICWDVGHAGLAPCFKYFTVRLSMSRVQEHQSLREDSSRIFGISSWIVG